MDKKVIKKYAIWAHTELLNSIEQKAAQYGITAKSKLNTEINKIGSHFLEATEIKQYCSLLSKIKQFGFQQTMEDVAYTWFIRFCALRFMEVNDYLPSHIRVFTDENNTFNPQILSDAHHLGDKFDEIDMKRVCKLIKNDDAREKLYQYLIITQCNALNSVLPGMFTRIEDDAELLFPGNLLEKTSVIGRLITDIPKEYFSIKSGIGQIEIIGWLYQYYISEKHEQLIDPLHGKNIDVEDIPVATQVFTPEWVVRYITDNTVGRYWIDHHPTSHLTKELTYYVTPKEISRKPTCIKPQDVTVFDPCVGSGHFLVYAIDVLIKIYRECGYSDQNAISEIISNNLFGLDIDERAAKLAYFATMMKGCQYDNCFLNRGISPHIYKIYDSHLFDKNFIDYFCKSNTSLKNDVTILVNALKDALETGSLLQLPSIKFDVVSKQIEQLKFQKHPFNPSQIHDFELFLNATRVISSKYATVITNPPYLNKFDAVLKSYLQKNYKDYSGDLFSAFIYRCSLYCIPEGYSGLMTPNVWMFIKSYKKLRQYLVSNHSITTLVQMAKGSFYREATVDVCAFVIQCQKINQDGVYFRLEDFSGNMDYQNEKLLEALADPDCKYKYHVPSALFQNIPGMPIGYWAGTPILQAFKTGLALDKIASPRQGLATTDNDKYLRHWFEVDYNRIGFDLDRKTATSSNIKWFPYNKGGKFRKWYGNQDYIVNYFHDGADIKTDVLTKYPYLKTPDFVVKNPDTYFSPCLSWSKISSGCVAFRFFPQGFLYDVSGCSIFFSHQNMLLYCAGFLNCLVSTKILEIISPTLNYETGHIATLPIIKSDKNQERVEYLVNENIALSKDDWNQFELSWNFNKHPLITITGKLIANKFKTWESECFARFNQLKQNEEELNRIFIDIYGLKNELTPEIDDKFVTVRKANLQCEIKSLLSYAVGCMFGRYSLDKDGLCFAGGDFNQQFALVNTNVNGHKSRCYLKEIFVTNSSQNNIEKHFGAIPDNIIPITDDDCFADDIVNLFVEFMRISYGKDTLDTNLKFIADALGKKGTPKNVIRDYFLNDFYDEHIKSYQKRPIYWLFNSGKKNGFKCLVYMHRYQPDTITRICTDYIPILKSHYLTLLSDLKPHLQSASNPEAVKLQKQYLKLQEQFDELIQYEEKLLHHANQRLAINLDDGVKVNYAKLSDVLSAL